MSEIVEVKVKIPKKLYEVVELICKTFSEDINEFIVENLKDSINSYVDSGFDGWLDGFVNDIKAKMDQVN